MKYRITFGLYEECQDEVGEASTPENAVMMAKWHSKGSGVALCYYHIELVDWE